MSEIQINCAHDAVVPLAELKPNARNPNLHPDSQIKLLAKIIQHQGWRAPITVSNQTGLIVVGHGRLAAAKLLGLDVVPVDYQDFLSEEDEWAHLLADNRLSELSETDGAVLKDVLLELDSGAFPMDVTGFDERELERVINSYGDHEQDAEPQIDRAAELQKEWGTATGQLWSIGEHRLLCGDATDKEDVDRVMGGQKADLLLTDPQYDMPCGGGPKAFLGGRDYGKKIVSTGLNSGFDLSILDGFERWVCFCSKNSLVELLQKAGVRNWMLVTWNKPNPIPMVNGTYLPDTEYIIHSYSVGKLFGAYEDRSRFITHPSEHNDIEHPTVKPLPVLGKMVRVASNKGETIFDPFLGSGTTLIAAANLGRRCFGIEISAPYVAVCLERMKNAFGIKGVLLDA